MGVYKNVSKWLKLFMPFIYLLIGGVLLISPVELFDLNSTAKLILAVMIIGYGLLRAYQTFFKKENHEE